MATRLNKSASSRAALERQRDFAPRQRFADLNRMRIVCRLGSFRAEFIYWGFLGLKTWRNYLHAHSFFEICYAFRGRGTFRISDKTCPVSAGNVFVARPGEAHEIISSRKDPLGIYFWAYTLVPTPVRTSEPADQTVDSLLHAFAGARHWVNHCEAMEATLRQLTVEVAGKEPGFTVAIEALAKKLLLDTARASSGKAIACEEAEPQPLSPSEAVTQTAIRYMRDNLTRPIEMRNIAAQVHLSERHLSRLFRKVTGQSVLDYLTALRIDTASQLLLDKEVPIKQVARAVGYPDVHYFTTLFGRRTGLTPAVFREKGGTRQVRANGKPVATNAR